MALLGPPAMSAYPPLLGVKRTLNRAIWLSGTPHKRDGRP